MNLNSDPKVVSLWGAIVVSVMILLIFAFGYGVALYFKIQDQIILFGQTAANMALLAVGYWLGSSVSSHKKDNVIESQLAASNDAKSNPQQQH